MQVLVTVQELIEFKLGYLQLICKASFIFKSNLELGWSIILKERELYESKYAVVECKCLKIWELLLKDKCQKQKLTFILNSPRYFVKNCPHFQAIIYTMKFNKVTIPKIFKLTCNMQFVTTVTLDWYSQTKSWASPNRYNGIDFLAPLSNGFNFKIGRDSFNFRWCLLAVFPTNKK